MQKNVFKVYTYDLQNIHQNLTFNSSDIKETLHS